MMPETFGYIDAILMVTCLLFALGGFQKGFAAQIAQFITFVVSAICLLFIYPFFFTLAQQSFNHVGDTYLMWLLLAVLCLFSLVFYIGTTKALSLSLKREFTERTDRALGMLLGMFRGIFIVLFFLVFIILLAPVKSYDILYQKSGLGRIVCDQIIPQIQPHMTPSNVSAEIRRARAGLRSQNAGGFYDR